jgi:hypothetical protein
MALISGTIPNLFNGVSQQPAPLRHPSQGELQENCYPSIASGLRKRPPTNHIAKLRNTTASDAHIHLINRDTVERYIVVLIDGDLEVYDINGVQKTVNFPSGKGYLDVDLPREDFSLMTVADYTFVVNRTIVTAMAAAASGATLTGTVQKFSDLPTTGLATGQVYKIQGDNTNQFDDYYVIRSASNVWTETLAPSTKKGFDAATMPYQLVRNGDGTFTFDKATWDERLVGSDTSNPIPSFIGKPLNGIFFHRNRLGVIADENVVLSRAGEYFNFWSETVTAVLDTDPIDEATSHTKVSIINHVIPFNKALLLFSDQTQFQITAGDVLTPKTASCQVVTEFESSEFCKPVSLGKTLYFAVEKGSSTGIREYFVDETTISNDAADVTAHVPSYVPTDVFKLAASSNDNAVMALTLEERNAVYVYKVYWNATEKVQSAWGKFLFDSTDVVLNCDFIGADVYFVIQRSDGIFLEVMRLQEFLVDYGMPFRVLLDRKQTLTGVYNSGTNKTTWTLPFVETGSMSVVLGPAFTSGSGSRLNTTMPTTTTLVATGDYSSHPCIVGRNYTQRYRLSEQYVRDGNGGSITSGVLKLRRMHLNYSSTGYFKVQVTPKARETYTYEFSGLKLGNLSALIGTPSITSGTFTFPVRTSNLGVTIDIINDTYLPSIFQAAEWDAEFVTKAQRI